MPCHDHLPRIGQKSPARRPHDLAESPAHAISLHGTAYPTGSDDARTSMSGRSAWQDTQQHELAVKRGSLPAHPLKLGGTEKPGGFGKSLAHFAQQRCSAAQKNATAAA